MPLAIALGPMLIAAALEIYKSLASDPETPEELREHYAAIVLALETADFEVQTSPLPDEGSGV